MTNGRKKEDFILSLINSKLRKGKTIPELYLLLEPFFFEFEIVEENKKLIKRKKPIIIPYSTFQKRILSLIQREEINAEKKYIPETGSRNKIYFITKKTKTNE